MKRYEVQVKANDKWGVAGVAYDKDFAYNLAGQYSEQGFTAIVVEVADAEQAAEAVKEAGGMVVLPENRERFDAQLKELHNAEGACNKALAKLNKLTAAIEDMKLDCDAEAYDALLEIADILGR